MPQLAESQASFATALIDPERSTPPDVIGVGSSSNSMRPGKRFDVYRNNVVVAGIDALGDMFPAVRRLVGEEFFRAAARVYMDETRPTSPVLFRYGDDFGHFLDTFPPAASVPYLGDVARLEYARVQAYHAADRSPIDVGQLADIPVDRLDQLRLVAHPSVALIRSRFPVASLWAASTGLRSSDLVDINCPEDAMVVRPNLEVDTRALPSGGGVFLQALLDGDPLAEAAEKAAAANSDFDLSTHLSGLFGAGAFVELTDNYDHERERPTP